MPRIAPSACVDPAAELADDVEVGPGCYVGPKVRIGAETRLLPNVTLLGRTDIGARNIFYPGAVIGAAPQDLKYQGTDTRLVIGDDNIFRESVTVHTGTEIGGGITKIGDRNQFQIGSHVAHDVSIGNHCLLSNQVQVAGHVVIEDAVNISALTGIQQFVTVGRYAFIAGLARVTTDVPPYLIYGGFDGAVIGHNEVGMRRWKFSEDQIARIRELYKLLYSKKAGRSGATISDRLAMAESNGALTEHEKYLMAFLKRTLHDGVFGRHLERARRDKQLPPPDFYKSTGA